MKWENSDNSHYKEGRRRFSNKEKEQMRRIKEISIFNPNDLGGHINTADLKGRHYQVAFMKKYELTIGGL